MHESFERVEEIERGSARGFGIIVTVVLSVIAVYQAWSGGSLWPYWAAAAGLLAGVTLLVPGVLAPFNRLWMKLALALSKALNPIVMALLFFGIVLPTGLILRMLGKDPLRLKWRREAASYWVERNPPGPAPDSLKNQF